MSKSIRCLLLGLTAALSITSSVQAQTAPISLDSVFVYSVKVACTTIQIPIGIDSPGIPGIREELSRTRINIHNPLDQTARFTYRVVQPRSRIFPGNTFAPVSESLDGFAARMLDCSDYIALQQTQPPGPLLSTEGFLVIESRARLQVATVYTQRVVKEGLKDEDTSIGLTAGIKNVFRGGEIPEAETMPWTSMPIGVEGAGPAGSDARLSSTAAAGVAGTSPPTATIEKLPDGGGVPIPILQHGEGPVESAAMGVGMGVGVGRGIGLGIGAGGGIDVEYVEPIVVPRRPVLRPAPPAGGGG